MIHTLFKGHIVTLYRIQNDYPTKIYKCTVDKYIRVCIYGCIIKVCTNLSAFMV